MVAVLLCLACLLFSSCEYDLENAFYRADDTDARTRVCYTLSDSETPHPSSELYTIAVFSDIHFGGKSSTRHEQDFLNWLEKSKEEGKCPEFCFCLGDITEHGKKSEFEAYNEFCKKVESLLGDGKVYNVLGNHDLYNNGWDNYKEMIFPYKSMYTFKTKTFSWYCIDSASGTLGKNQYDTLKSLFANDSAPKIILTHVPAYSNPLNYMGYFSFQNTYESDMLLTLYSKNNVKSVFSGHIHQSYKNYFNNFVEITVPCITQSNQWSLITIDENKGTVSELVIHGGE
ncbi:MAG: metallophosphoesterase [Treponema sp.]|nr:metallophosphoesterase [Treponema sp.]